MVVGGTRGIGLSTVKLLKARGYEVIVGCRKGNDALVELGVTIVEGVDIEFVFSYLNLQILKMNHDFMRFYYFRTGAVESLVRATEGKTIDILFCNAAIANLESLKVCLCV